MGDDNRQNNGSASDAAVYNGKTQFLFSSRFWQDFSNQ